MNFLNALGSGIGDVASGLGNFAGSGGQLGSGLAAGAQAAAQPHGMFGAFHNWLSSADAGGLTGADKLNALGAGLKDMAPGSQGGNLAAAQNTIARRASDHALDAYAGQVLRDPRDILAYRMARAGVTHGFAPGRYGAASAAPGSLTAPWSPTSGDGYRLDGGPFGGDHWGVPTNGG